MTLRELREETMDWPKELTINAWTGEAAPTGKVSQKTVGWALGRVTKPPRVVPTLRPGEDANPKDWRHPDIGWGLVLPERDGLSQSDLASGSDAPEPIRRLLAQRGNAPVFRYRAKDKNKYTLLRNYGTQKDVDMRGAPQGVGDSKLPLYLLIYGTPEEIPWDIQYILNARCAVGRLDLTGEELNNYVTALLNGWKDSASQVDKAVLWAVDHGAADITRLMRTAIAAQLYEEMSGDKDIESHFLDGTKEPATVSRLTATLVDKRPCLVVTTSHGQTGPADKPDIMRAHLGLPVDQEYNLLDAAKLLEKWQPDGAVWYAHACCSAGGDSQTIFDGVVEQGSPVDKVLKAVAGLGATVAPLPRALLGAAKPLRAFIGHVEPTFDWTLRNPNTKEHLTKNIRQALYNNLYRSQPVGLAFRPIYAPLGTLYLSYEAAYREYNKGKDEQLSSILYCQLAARDLQSSVLLGDPTAVLPDLPEKK
jgi:hypothetical protein